MRKGITKQQSIALALVFLLYLGASKTTRALDQRCRAAPQTGAWEGRGIGPRSDGRGTGREIRSDRKRNDTRKLPALSSYISELPEVSAVFSMN